MSELCHLYAIGANATGRHHVMSRYCDVGPRPPVSPHLGVPSMAQKTWDVGEVEVFISTVQYFTRRCPINDSLSQGNERC